MPSVPVPEGETAIGGTPAGTTPTVGSEPVFGPQAGPRRSSSRRRPVSKRRVALEWVVVLLIAVAVAMLVRATLVQAFYIPSESMVPTLKVGDQLLVDKVTFHLRDPRRGDIVVFERPPGARDKTVKDLVKRIIGLPGETVETREGKVYVNGLALAERYLRTGVTTLGISRQIVPVDSYYVLGDNRSNSADSRYFGPISRSLIVGRAFFRVYPPTRIGRF